MSKQKINVNVARLAATSEGGIEFEAIRSDALRNGKPGWSIEGGMERWPSVSGIDQDEATRLLSDCIAAYDERARAMDLAQERFDERVQAIRDYFKRGGDPA